MHFFAIFALCALAQLPTATIKQGVVIGTTTRLPGAAATVNKFIGIPFAKTPPLRFELPQEPASWTTPRKAQTTRAACYQTFVYPLERRQRTTYLYNNPGGPTPEESEDCLYINVYAPAGSRPGSNKAVMFSIFGGNYVFGTGGILYYDGTSFATNQDVIVVTFNGRTGGSKQIPIEKQNIGLYDIRFALSWVQTNIRAFGGDPAKVTIFGQSSGGYTVKQLILKPPRPLPFRAGIMQSEGALKTQTAAEGWGNLTTLLGCTNLATQLTCMRGKSAAEIKNTAEVNSLGFFAVDDGVTHTSDVYGELARGNPAKVPFIIGSMKDDARPYLWVAGVQNNKTASLRDYLEELFPDNPGLTNSLVLQFADQPTYIALATITSFLFYQCKAAKLSRAAHLQGFSVYRYLYYAVFPNLQRFPDAGAWHSSEIPTVWDNLPPNWGASTPDQIALTKYMQTTWANFAKDPSRGPRPNWFDVGVFGRLLAIGQNNNPSGFASVGANIDTLCQGLSVVGNSFQGLFRPFQML